MSDDFAKFLFLGAMILIVLVSSRGLVYREAEKFTTARVALVATEEPPIFVLEPPQAEKKEERGKMKEIVPIAVTPPVLSENTQIVVPKPKVAQEGDTSLPKVNAASALVADFNGNIFFELYGDRRWPVASITKLVAAAVVSKNLPMHESVTIAAEDFPLGTGENGLKEGERYSVQDLLTATLMQSSNQATEALARFYGRENFISAMNALALEWGLQETRFEDPTGLSVVNQSTAEDLAMLARAIYDRHPELLEITRRESATITELDSERKVIINNINLFAGRADFIGGKTGYTDEAGGNLLSIFSYDNKPVVVVVLGTDDRFGETEKLFNWFRFAH